MRPRLSILCIVIAILLMSGIHTGELVEATPFDGPPALREIRDFVTQEGRVDVHDVDVTLNKAGYTQAAHGLPGRLLIDHPDDIFWENSLAPSITGADLWVNAMIVYNGQWILGGDFEGVGDVRGGIAAWDGSSWQSVGQGFVGRVNAFAIYDDKLIVAGQFTLTADGPRYYIATWDGSVWSPLGTGAPGGIKALTVYGNQLIAGGYFSTIDGLPANKIAAWNGSEWATLGSGSSGGLISGVKALAVYDNKLIVGGKFESVGGVSANNIASWDGSTWMSLGSGLSSSQPIPVSALAVYDNMLIAGGYFYNNSGDTLILNIAAWDGFSWFALGSGTSGDGLRRSVRSLTVFEDKLVAAGDFTVAGNEPANRIAFWDGTTWSTFGTGIGSWIVNAVTVYNGQLIAGGDFGVAGETVVNNIASWDGFSWGVLGSGTGGYILATTTYDGKLIAGGTFTTIGGVTANYVAAWNGVSWEALGTGISGGSNRTQVRALTVYDGQLIVAGDFTSAGGTPVAHIASWDGSSWSALGTGLTGDQYGYYGVNALAVYDDQLIAGGHFNNAGGTSANLIASWDGSSWSAPGNTQLDGVSALAVYQGKLYAGGWFSKVGPMNAMLTYWDGSSWRIAGFQGIGLKGESVTALTVHDHKLVVGGSFRKAGNLSVENIVAWDGYSWIPLGDGLPKGTGQDGVKALTSYNGKLIAGGEFSESLGAPTNTVAAWDGISWQTLGSGTNRWYVLALGEYDRELVVGGFFSVAGNKTSGCIALWIRRAREVSMDIRPGTCQNPLNGVNFRGQARGQEYVSAAILGLPDFNVRDITPESIMMHGINPVSWEYQDVSRPVSKTSDSCACEEDLTGDGYEDIVLSFERHDVVNLLNGFAIIPHGGKPVEEPDSLLTGNKGGNSRLPLRGKYVLCVTGRLLDGSEIIAYDCVTLTSKGEAVERSVDKPAKENRLLGNYPNPFNPVTQISFVLPEATHVEIDIYNILGQRVARLVNEILESGEHIVEWDGSSVASGVYFYRLMAGEHVETKKMLLLK